MGLELDYKYGDSPAFGVLARPCFFSASHPTSAKTKSQLMHLTKVVDLRTQPVPRSRRSRSLEFGATPLMKPKGRSRISAGSGDSRAGTVTGRAIVLGKAPTERELFFKGVFSSFSIHNGDFSILNRDFS